MKSKIMTAAVVLFILYGFYCDRFFNTLPPDDCVLSEQEAYTIAEDFRKTTDAKDWGVPIETLYQDNKFHFIYETPPTELGLLGPRAIWVDCKTGEVEFVLRM